MVLLIHAHHRFSFRPETSKKQCESPNFFKSKPSLSLIYCLYRLLLNRFYDMQQGKGEFRPKVCIIILRKKVLYLYFVCVCVCDV